MADPKLQSPSPVSPPQPNCDTDSDIEETPHWSYRISFQLWIICALLVLAGSLLNYLYSVYAIGN